MATITVDEKLCKGCELCVEFCPQGVLRMSDRYNSRGYHFSELFEQAKKCSGCSLCARVCPDVVIEVFR